MIAINENNFQLMTVSPNNGSQVIDIFHGSQGSKIITIPANTNLKYLFLASWTTNIDLQFVCVGDHGHVTVRGLLLGTAESKIEVKVNASLEASHTKADLHIVSFITKSWACTLDGNVLLWKNINQASWRLLEENIIVWDKVHIKTLPRLDVYSNDVQASHGATIQRIDNEKLFYLRSRWLGENDAKKLIIEGYFSQLFSIFGGQIDAARVKVQYIDELLHKMNQ